MTKVKSGGTQPADIRGIHRCSKLSVSQVHYHGACGVTRWHMSHINQPVNPYQEMTLVVLSGFEVRRKSLVICFSVFSSWPLISDEDCAPYSTSHSVFGADVQAHEFRLRGCSHDAPYGADMSWFCQINRLLRACIHQAIAEILSHPFFRHHIQNFRRLLQVAQQ